MSAHLLPVLLAGALPACAFAKARQSLLEYELVDARDYLRGDVK